MKKLALLMAFLVAVMPMAFASMPDTTEKSATIKVTNDNYNALVDKHDLLVIDFWAPWCGPCRALAPTLEALASEYKGKVAIGKCNVDENRTLTSNFGVRGIPAIFFIKNGKVVDSQVGLCDKAVLKAKIEKWR